MVSGALAPLYTVFGLKLGYSGAAAPIGDKVLQNGEIFRLFVCPSIRPSVHLSIHPFPPLRAQEQARQALDPSSQASEPAKQASEPLRPGWLALRPACLALKPAWLALRPDWLGLRPAWLALGPSRGGWTDGRTYGWMYGQTENLPILQDFIPYQGCCPATAQLQPKNCIKWGKGTANHMMPLGDWFGLRQEAKLCRMGRFFGSKRGQSPVEW